MTVEVADKVATVTLNRPQARNAINQKLIRELRTIWDDLADDHAVNVVVLTGAGDFFSVGGDVKAMSERPGGDVLEEGEIHDPMISRRAVTRQLELDKPIIAAINGDAIGLAATHALLCDITVMAEDARIGDTHVSRVGLVAGDGGTVIWPRARGRAPFQARAFGYDRTGWCASCAAAAGLAFAGSRRRAVAAIRSRSGRQCVARSGAAVARSELVGRQEGCI